MGKIYHQARQGIIQANVFSRLARVGRVEGFGNASDRVSETELVVLRDEVGHESSEVAFSSLEMFGIIRMALLPGLPLHSKYDGRHAQGIVQHKWILPIVGTTTIRQRRVPIENSSIRSCQSRFASLGMRLRMPSSPSSRTRVNLSRASWYRPRP